MSCSYNKHYRNDEHRVGPIVRLWRMFCVSKERVFVWVEVRSWEEGTGDAVLRMYMKGTRCFRLEEIAPWWSFYSSFISVLVSIGVVTKYPSERLRQWRSILFWLWMLEDLGTRQVGCCFQLSDGNNFLLCSCDRERNLCPYFFIIFVLYEWVDTYIDCRGHQIPLEPGLQMVESHHGKAGNQPSILCKICQYSEYHWVLPQTLRSFYSPQTFHIKTPPLRI